MALRDIIFLAVLFFAVFLSIGKEKLTLVGGLTGGLIACGIYLGAGFTGIAMLGTFFILGTLATSLGMKTKHMLGVAEHDKGRRTAGQVIANGGIAGILGLLAWIYPHQSNILAVMMAASLSSATADTLSSELGTVYGKRFYNILTLCKDKRGANGVISAEGTLAGIAGSFIIAAVYSIGFTFSSSFIWIVLAGTLGNFADSLLGATLERKGYIGNNTVNLLNTLTAAILALPASVFVSSASL